MKRRLRAIPIPFPNFKFKYNIKKVTKNVRGRLRKLSKSIVQLVKQIISERISAFPIPALQTIRPEKHVLRSVLQEIV